MFGSERSLKITPELLGGVVELNAGYLVGNWLSIDIFEALDMELNQIVETFSEEYGKDLDTERVHYNMAGWYTIVRRDLIPFLIERAGELFSTDGTTPVTLIGTTGVAASRDLMLQPDFLGIRLCVDGDKLYQLYKTNGGVDNVPDGYHSPGFYRTCSDKTWAIFKVLKYLYEDEVGIDEGLLFLEFFREEFSELINIDV